MSAYASLPGSFLPPFFSFGGSKSPTSASSSTEGNGGKSECLPNEGTGDTKNSATTEHEQQTIAPSVSSPKLYSDESVTSYFSTLAMASPPQSKTEKQHKQQQQQTAPTSTPRTRQPSDIIIAIKSARVDTVGLIQSLTSRGSNIARRTANFISRSDGASSTSTLSGEGGAQTKSQPDEVSVQSSKPALCYEDSDSEDDEEMSFYDYDDDFSSSNDNEDSTQQHERDAQTEASDSSGNEDLAIQFDLSITFQGRKYTATRPFSTFVKLRYDLMRELKLYNGDVCENVSVRDGRSKRCAREPSKGTDKFVDCMSELPASRDQAIPTTVSIPELPSLDGNNTSSMTGRGGYVAGVARCGFAMLQATAKMYCPEMESWLKHVIDAVPCSPSLSRFLWEPLASSSESWDTDGAAKDCGDVRRNCDSAELEQKIKASYSTTIKTVPTFAKPPQHRNSKPRSNNLPLGKRYISRGSVGSLNSIEEGDQLEEDSS